MIKLSLRTKFSFSYIILALFLVGLVSFTANFLLENQFRDYMIKQIESNNKDIVSSISQQYQSQNNEWNLPVIESIGINALEQGLILKITDAEGKIIWDATVHNNGLCIQMISHMSENMASRYHNFQGGYIESNYPVLSNFIIAGNVQIGYYGPFYLNDNDLAFINTLNRMIMAVGFLSLVVALAFGAIMAKRLSTPISKVMGVTKQIAKGCYNERITQKSNTTEIIQLTTSVNNLAENLQTQELLRKRLTSDVAHELRTPLATLQSHMEAMIDGVWDADTERLKSCHEEILRINRLVGDLEKLARYEGENLTLNKCQFDLASLIKHLIKSMEAEFLSKGVAITFKGEETEIIADSDKISQVIMNLLSNALKFTPTGERVEVSLKATDNDINISVADSGIGISEEDLPYIFERFYRADKSRNRMTGGSGIGLAIAKAIVEAHHGRITVESKLHEGTTFHVSIPK